MRSGDYEFRRELGRGGMGVVYEARQISLNRRVAVKMLMSGVFGSTNHELRFRAEAAAAARLRHPNIVTIHDVGKLDGQPFFAMELIEGPSLADLTCERPLTSKRAARYLRLITEAIAHAHDAGVWHRDIKPSNVLVDGDDQPKVTDFGLAKQLDSTTDLTRTGEVFGSPSYLPPEKISGEHVGPEGDIYSLGAVLYQLLTARPPFVGETVASTLQQVLHAEPVPPRQINPSVPRDLQVICLKCLHKEPGRRYSSAADLAADLKRFENAQPIQARPASIAEQWVLWCRRKPMVAALAAALALAIVGGFVGVLWQWEQARGSRDEMRLNLYAADVSAAAIAVRQGNLGIARALLKPYALEGRSRRVESSPKDQPGMTSTGAETTPTASGAGVRPRPPSDVRGFEWRLLWQQCQSSELTTFGTHAGTVTTVAVSPDGLWIASGGDDLAGEPSQTLQVWNLPRREFVASLRDAGSIQSLAFTEDSGHLISGGSRGVRFWQIPSGREVKRGQGLAGQTIALAGKAPVLVASPWHPSGTPTPETLVAYDTRTETARALPVAGWFPAVSADGRQLAYLDARRNIQLWDLATSRPLRTVATNRLLFTLRFSPDGRHLAAAGRMTHARVWDLNEPGKPPQLFAHERNVWLADFSPDGRTLLTASSDQTIRLWDLATGEMGLELRGHGNEVRTAAFSADGRLLVSGSKDQSVRLWSTKPLAAPFKAKQKGSVTPLFSPTGSQFVSCHESEGRQEATVWRWDEAPEAPGSGVSGEMPRGPYSPFSNASKIGLIPGCPLGFAPDGRHVVVYREAEATLQWWLPGGGDSARTVPLVEAPRNLKPDQSGISGDGTAFFLGNSSGTIWIWDTATGVLRGKVAVSSVFPDIRDRPRFSERFFSSLAMDHEGRTLAASVYSDPALVICNLATARVQRLPGHRDWSRQVAFSPNGKTLASGSVDGTIRLWDTATAREIAVLAGHLEETSAVAFSPDGRTLASLNQGLEMKLWHLPTRRELAVFPMSTAGMRLAFSPDGRRIAMNQADGHVVIWDAPFPK